MEEILTPYAVVFDELRALLEIAGIRYAVGGSWASTMFGEPRFTNDIDILAEFSVKSLSRFLSTVPKAFYVDKEGAITAFQSGQPFNIIHMESVLKFDFFPSNAFPLGLQELDRATLTENTGLSASPIPFVSAEDIVLAKLYWFRPGGKSSEVQWRDVIGLVQACSPRLDYHYLEENARVLRVQDLLEKLLGRVDHA